MRRVFYVFMIFVFISFMAIGVTLSYLADSYMEQATETTVKRDLEILATTTQGALANNDYERVEEDVFLWGELDPQIVSFKVKLDDDIELVKYTREIQTSNILSLTQNASLPSGRIIIFSIEYDMSEHDKEVAIITAFFLTMSGCIALVFAFLLWRILQRLAFIPLNHEITERKRAEELLSLRNRAISEADNGIVITAHESPDSPLLYANPAYLHTIGYTLEEILGKDLRFLQGKEPSQPGLEELRNAIRKQEPCTVVIKNFRKDGSMFFNELSISPVRDEKGKITHYIGITRDITDHKRTQERIEDLAKFPSENPNSVLRVSRKGKLLYTNPAAKSLTTEWDCQVGQSVPNNWKNIITDAFQEGTEKRVEIEHDGKVLCFSISAVIEKDYANLYGRDITERKEAEDMLRESELNYRAIFNSVKDAIAIHDAQTGAILEVNSSFLTLFGYTIEEASTLTVEGISEGNPPYSQTEAVKFMKSAADGESPMFEWMCKDKQGRLFWVEVNLKLVKLRGHECIIAVIRDITERKQAKNQLIEAKEQAESANVAKSLFLANMSHEIRTPMSIILGFMDIIAKEGLSDKQRDSADIMKKAGKSLLQVINDILDFSRIEAGKLEIDLTDCLVAEMLSDIEFMIKPSAEEKGLDFQVLHSGDLPSVMHTDHDRVNQCLLNLLNNAVKFTHTGHVHLNVYLEHRDEVPYIRFDVEDTGIGISSEMHEHIFDSFTQADETLSRNYGGTGLGLAITTKLARMLGGDLTLSSEVGAGSVFSLTIPACVDLEKSQFLDSEEHPKKPVPQPEKTPELQFSGKILMAEDSEGFQILARKLFERMGLEIETVDNGKDAVERAIEQSYDLVFMDMQMPLENGYEATQELRQKGIATPIVALTAHAMAEDCEKCLEAGCDDYISKPIDNDKLVEILNKYLPAHHQ